MAQSSLKKSNDSPVVDFFPRLLGGEIHDCDEASVASHLNKSQSYSLVKLQQAAQIPWKNNAVRLCIQYMHI